jgi:hypothetical protein
MRMVGVRFEPDSDFIANVLQVPGCSVMADL